MGLSVGDCDGTIVGALGASVGLSVSDWSTRRLDLSRVSVFDENSRKRKDEGEEEIVTEQP